MAERAKSVFCFSNLFLGLLDILDVDLPCGFFPFFNSNFFIRGCIAIIITNLLLFTIFDLLCIVCYEQCLLFAILGN